MFNEECKDKIEFLKWVSEKNKHIPLFELEYLFDLKLDRKLFETQLPKSF